MSSIGRRRIAARVLAYREIFQYHGVWAPGVRLLQNLKFRNKALLLDAVFWTYDEDRRLPLYLRADVIRQESQQEFSGERARTAPFR